MDVMRDGAQLRGQEVLPMLLRRTLATNAAFTGASALVMALFAPRLAAAIGLDSAVPVWVAAAVFVPYAVLLVLSARRPRVRDAALFVAADAAYVAACLALAAWPGLLNGVGKELVILSALVVAVFIACQWLGLQRLRSLAA
jgi:hypothetical protein